MKQIQELSIKDLEHYAVWEYHGSDDSSAYVLPTSYNTLQEYKGRVFIALTHFQLANGSLQIGYCLPQDSSGLDYIKPVLIIDGIHIQLWPENPLNREEAEKQWQVLGMKMTDVFPIYFHCLVPVDGQDITGTVELLDVLRNLDAKSMH